MAGLVPAIHVLLIGQGVDARHKAGHDDVYDVLVTSWSGAKARNGATVKLTFFDVT